MRVPYTRNWESKDRALQRGEARTGGRENLEVGRKAAWVR